MECFFGRFNLTLDPQLQGGRPFRSSVSKARARPHCRDQFANERAAARDPAARPIHRRGSKSNFVTNSFQEVNGRDKVTKSRGVGSDPVQRDVDSNLSVLSLSKANVFVKFGKADIG